MLNISKELFTAWNKEGLLYCHWKSNEHLLPGLNGQTDLDVLLSRDDSLAGVEVLRGLNFLQCKSQYGARYPGVDDWIGFDKVTGSLIHVHLHYGLVTGHKGMKEYSLLWTDMALRTRIFNEEYGIYIMEPNLELVTLFTRIGLKADIKSILQCRLGKFKLSSDIQREIDWLKERVDNQKVNKLLESYYHNNAKILQSLISKREIDADDFLLLRKITEKTFKKCSRIKSFVRAREFVFTVYSRWGKHIFYKIQPIITKKVPICGKGISIVFVGQDGSGKSTVTKDIMNWLRWKIEANIFYMGTGDQFNPLEKRLLRKMPDSNNAIIKSSKNLLSFSLYVKAAKSVKCSVNKASRYIAKGGIAIFDRYPQVQFYGISDGPKIREKINKKKYNRLLCRAALIYAKKEERLIKEASNQYPNLVFKLMLPPEESIRRKPFEKIENVKQKHKIISELSFPQSNVYTIDATQDYNKELIQIKNIIWEHILKL